MSFLIGAILAGLAVHTVMKKYWEEQVEVERFMYEQLYEKSKHKEARLEEAVRYREERYEQLQKKYVETETERISLKMSISSLEKKLKNMEDFYSEAALYDNRTGMLFSLEDEEIEVIGVI